MEPGWYFTLYPFEKVFLFPKKQYKFIYLFSKGVYTKETSTCSSQPVTVVPSLHFTWPEVNKNYKFPITEQEAREQGLDPDQMDDEDLDEDLVWGEVSGEYLLVNYSFPHLSVDDLVGGLDQEEIIIEEEEEEPDGPDRKLGKFLEPALGGASRQVVQEKNHKYWRKSQSAFEDRMRDYLTKEIANPIVNLGIPKACLNIELTRFEVPEETIQAYMEPELERKRAEAAEQAIEKARFEKEQLQYRIEAYLEKGIPPWMAALAAGDQMEGESLSEQQMRDWMFIMMLGNIGGSNFNSKQGLKDLLEEILEILQSM